MNRITKVLLAVLVCGALGVVAWRTLQREAPEFAATLARAPVGVREALAPPTVPVPVPTDGEVALEHPVATDPYVSLPTLDTSDAELVGELTPLVPAETFGNLIDPQSLVRRVVVAVDNLPGGRLPMKQRPVKAVPGEFAVSGDEDTLVIATTNHARYAPLIAVAEQLDVDALARVYHHYYPLFQQAYQEVGYPDAYFNDRLVDVIDHLLAADAVAEPIRLVRPNVLYRYADPALEARSPGEKILLRMGADNAARVKTVLRRLRIALLRDAPVAN